MGCHVAGMYVGVVGYADDLLLLAPTREAAQRMLQICEAFTKTSNIMFSTNVDPKKSKSKALYVVGPRGSALPRPAPLQLCGRPLPWVERADHLGHSLHQDDIMDHDCLEKRAHFIDSSVKIRETFYFAHPAEQIAATEKYCTAAYGSNLWDLGSPAARMMVNAWRTGHKLAWAVPRSTHTYLVEEVLAPGVPNLHVSLLHRFTNFFRGLITSPSKEVMVVGGGPAGSQRPPEQHWLQPGDGEDNDWAGPVDSRARPATLRPGQGGEEGCASSGHLAPLPPEAARLSTAGTLPR